MTKCAALSLSTVMTFLLAACGDNIRPSGADECFDEDCLADVDSPDAGGLAPDAGAPTPDAESPTPDAGDPTPDAGTPPSDGGTGSTCAPEEVRICHVPPGDPASAHVACVGPNAARAHLAHGDSIGDCP